MARIKLLDAEKTPFHVKEIFGRVEKIVGVVPNQLRAVANSPDFIMPLATTMQVVHRSPGISNRVKELAAIKVSKLNGSEYDVTHNTAAGRAAGLNEEDLAALDNGEHARFSTIEQEVLALAEKMTRSPQAVSDSDIESLKKHFSDAQVVELVYTIGVYNFTNRLNLALGIELEENFRFRGLPPESAAEPAKPRGRKRHLAAVRKRED